MTFFPFGHTRCIRTIHGAHHPKPNAALNFLQPRISRRAEPPHFPLPIHALIVSNLT